MCSKDADIPASISTSVLLLTLHEEQRIIKHVVITPIDRHITDMYINISEPTVAGIYNWHVIQLKAHEAKDKRDLETRERYWIEQLKPTLNMLQISTYQRGQSKNIVKTIRIR